MRPPVLLPVLMAGLTVSACELGADGVAANGAGGQRSYPIEAFTKVELAGNDDVEVRVGPGFSVRAEGPVEVLDRLRIDRDGDMLEIGRKKGTSGEGKVRVLVTMPKIDGAAVAGSGTMRVDKAAGEKFEAELAGSGNLLVGQIAAQRVEAEIAGSGIFRAAGTARRLEVSIAGSGNVEAPQLLASEAEISLAGSGDVRATVNGRAEVNIMGSGDVDLGQGARCEVNKMGSGSVRCGGQ